MKIQIMRVKDDIMVTTIDLQDIKSKEEIAYTIAELERIKLKLLAKWEKCI